jgi:hypothetical protein
MTVFKDDNAGYLAWLAANPQGFVVNSDREPKASYLVLHRATCEAISSPQDRNWSGPYIKTCSTDLPELENWAKTLGGQLSHGCPSCKP